MALRGKPTVALITSPFWEQGDFVAQAAGMPDLPRIQLPHPVAGSSSDAMAELALELAPQIIAALTSPTAAVAS